VLLEGQQEPLGKNHDEPFYPSLSSFLKSHILTSKGQKRRIGLFRYLKKRCFFILLRRKGKKDRKK